MRHPIRPLLAIGAMGLAATLCTPVKADPIYSLLTTIAVPVDEANGVGGQFTSFDISFFDSGTQLDYVADRSNAAVDIFSAATDSFVGRVGGFVGIQPGSNTSGPNGVLVTNLPSQHSLWAGDGNSTVLGFDLNAGNAPLPNTPIATGTPADNRADEMAFDSLHKRLIVANDAASTPFVTIINTASDTILTKIAFDGGSAPLATNGLEQPVWNPNTKLFYISVPQINGSGPGAVTAINPANGKVVATFDLAAFGIGGCGPTGLALGAGNQMMIGCGDAKTQAILFDPTANGGKGGVVKTFSQVSGSDEVWYDPVTKRFFVSGSNDQKGPLVAVIDGAADEWLQNIDTVAGSHSVAVDDVSGDLFVPFRAGNTICPNGCIAVFGLAQVPEPGSLPMMLTGLTIMAGFAFRRRRFDARP